MKHGHHSSLVYLLMSAVLTGAAASARANIVSVTGMAQLIPAPSTVMPGASYASLPNFAAVWDEQQSVPASGVPADMVNNPATITSAAPGAVSGLLDSHYIHYRHTSSTATGTVTFSGKIVAVEFQPAALDATDGMFAPAGTTYQSSMFSGGFRGAYVPFDYFSVSGNTLTFDLWGSMPNDTAEIRVLTEHVPAPGAGVLAVMALGAAGLRRRR